MRGAVKVLGRPGVQRGVIGAGIAVTLFAGVVLRFAAGSPLWLDEALTVNLAALAPAEIPGALRLDGHPPLYYFLLHGWMRVFGEGQDAVRALSGVLGVGVIVAAWFCGRRLAGSAGAWMAAVLVASSPFAVRYATEARMYALVMLLVLVGWLALARAWERPAAGRLAVVAACTGALLLTHYWALFLVAVVGAGLLVAARRPERRSVALRVLAAVALGGLVLVPWLPFMAYQLVRTGTPWGEPFSLIDAVIVTLTDFGGGPRGEFRVLGILLADAAVLGVLARADGPRRIVLELLTRPGVRATLGVAVATFAVAQLAGRISGSAYQTRYAAVVLPLFLLAGAFGLLAFVQPWARAGVAAVLVVIGLVGGWRAVDADRTQAGQAAAVVNAGADPGDIVVYCPDQLGPAVSRLLGPDLAQTSFPLATPPQLVDWTDYAERNEDSDPEAFAQRVLMAAGPEQTVWVVWMYGYRTMDTRCERLVAHLERLRPGRQVLVADPALFERHNVNRIGRPEPPVFGVEGTVNLLR